MIEPEIFVIPRGEALQILFDIPVGEARYFDRKTAHTLRCSISRNKLGGKFSTWTVKLKGGSELGKIAVKRLVK